MTASLGLVSALAKVSASKVSAFEKCLYACVRGLVCLLERAECNHVIEVWVIQMCFSYAKCSLNSFCLNLLNQFDLNFLYI